MDLFFFYLINYNKIVFYLFIILVFGIRSLFFKFVFCRIWVISFGFGWIEFEMSEEKYILFVVFGFLFFFCWLFFEVFFIIIILFFRRICVFLGILYKFMLFICFNLMLILLMIFVFSIVFCMFFVFVFVSFLIRFFCFIICLCRSVW